jgi:hypothetical protein
VRSLDELRFIRDRVLAEIRTTPPQGPLLTELYPEIGPETPRPDRPCPRGHDDWMLGSNWKCRACQNEGRRRRRAEGRAG